jgi:hypothetical protein
MVVSSRCADLDRVDAQTDLRLEELRRAQRVLSQTRKDALARKNASGADSISSEDTARIEDARAAVVAARVAAVHASQSAKTLGSGDPGDRQKSVNRGSLVDVYA